MERDLQAGFRGPRGYCQQYLANQAGGPVPDSKDTVIRTTPAEPLEFGEYKYFAQEDLEY